VSAAQCRLGTIAVTCTVAAGPALVNPLTYAASHQSVLRSALSLLSVTPFSGLFRWVRDLRLRIPTAYSSYMHIRSLLPLSFGTAFLPDKGTSSISIISVPGWITSVIASISRC
jgi:hypothetical protein